MVGISFYSEVYNCNQTKEGKMNMKKKILLGLVIILCCFTGCSSNSSKNRDDNNPPEIKMSDIETDDSDIKYFEAKNNNGDEIELSYYTEIQVRVTKKLADIQ